MNYVERDRETSVCILLSVLVRLLSCLPCPANMALSVVLVLDLCFHFFECLDGMRSGPSVVICVGFFNIVQIYVADSICVYLKRYAASGPQ